MRDPGGGIPKSHTPRVGDALSVRSAATAKWAVLGAAWAAVGLPRAARAAGLPPVPALADPGTGDDEPAVEEAPAAATPQASPLVITGYVDVGFAKAQGNGTSWPNVYSPPMPASGMPAPPDYYVDTFAPAVNSRGDVASTVAPQPAPGMTNAPLNGFLPRSAGIGSKPSFLLNTANVDMRYTATDIPVLVFTRVQLVPRLYGPSLGPGE